jgi:hypothetical protein
MWVIILAFALKDWENQQKPIIVANVPANI